MPKQVKKVFDVFSTIIVVLVVCLTILLVGVRLIGLQVFTVLSGSMEPEYPTGSLIYVKKVEPHELETGDVITYMISEDTVVTHRIAGVVPDDEDPNIWRFRTKGDANSMEDATLVHEQNILGSPLFSIPYMGYVADYIQNPPGTYYSIAFGALLLMLLFVPDLFDDDSSKKKKEEKVEKAAAEDIPLLQAVEEAEPVTEVFSAEPAVESPSEPAEEPPAPAPEDIPQPEVADPPAEPEKRDEAPPPAPEPQARSSAPAKPRRYKPLPKLDDESFELFLADLKTMLDEKNTGTEN